jgi:hypothetical protein
MVDPRPVAATGKARLGAPAVEALCVIVEKNGAEVNLELVERLAEREQRNWTYFGRLRHEREKKLRDPQDVLIEGDSVRHQREEAPASATRNSGTIASRPPHALP